MSTMKLLDLNNQSNEMKLKQIGIGWYKVIIYNKIRNSNVTFLKNTDWHYLTIRITK